MNRDEIARAYCSKIYFCINMLKELEKNNSDISRLQNRFAIYMREYPRDVIQDSQKYIYKHSDKILERDAKYFLTRKYNQPMGPLKEEKQEVFMQFINLIKLLWRKLKNDQKEMLWSIAGDLVTLQKKYDAANL